MNRRARLLVVLFSLSLPGTALAAPLIYQGILTLEFGTLAPLTAAGSGVATVNGSAPAGGPVTALALPGGAIATTSHLVDLTDPAALPIEGVQLSVAAGAGSFSGAPLGGVLPLSGVFKTCLFMDCTSASVPANVSIPLSVVGAGGASAASAFVNVSVYGAPWTTGTANIGSVTRTGLVHGPLSATSSAATLGGQIRLVTPILISTNIGAGITPIFFATLDLRFVPEPTTALLLGAGVAGLAARGRRLGRARRASARARPPLGPGADDSPAAGQRGRGLRSAGHPAAPPVRRPFPSTRRSK